MPGSLPCFGDLANIPVAPENFIVAKIDVSHLGPDQPEPVSPDEIWPEAPRPESF